MGKQLAALAALVGACMLAAGCTNVVDGTAVAADKSDHCIRIRYRFQRLKGCFST